MPVRALRYAVKDESRVWPVQQYRLASGRDAFLEGLLSLHEDEEKRTKGWIERKLAPVYDPAKEVGKGSVFFSTSRDMCGPLGSTYRLPWGVCTSFGARFFLFCFLVMFVSIDVSR